MRKIRTDIDLLLPFGARTNHFIACDDFLWKPLLKCPCSLTYRSPKIV